MSDIHRPCSSMTWLLNLLQQQHEDGAFKSLRRIVAVENSHELKRMNVQASFGTSASLPTDTGEMQSVHVNQRGLCPWLETSSLDVQLFAAISSRFEKDALKIICDVANGHSRPGRRPSRRKSPFRCSTCHHDHIPGHHEYPVS